MTTKTTDVADAARSLEFVPCARASDLVACFGLSLRGGAPFGQTWVSFGEFGRFVAWLEGEAVGGKAAVSAKRDAVERAMLASQIRSFSVGVGIPGHPISAAIPAPTSPPPSPKSPVQRTKSPLREVTTVDPSVVELPEDVCGLVILSVDKPPPVVTISVQKQKAVSVELRRIFSLAYAPKKFVGIVTSESISNRLVANATKLWQAVRGDRLSKGGRRPSASSFFGRDRTGDLSRLMCSFAVHEGPRKKSGDKPAKVKYQHWLDAVGFRILCTQAIAYSPLNVATVISALHSGGADEYLASVATEWGIDLSGGDPAIRAAVDKCAEMQHIREATIISDMLKARGIAFEREQWMKIGAGGEVSVVGRDPKSRASSPESPGTKVYIVDFAFLPQRLVLEIDENGHRDRDPAEERARHAALSKAYALMRVNPDSHTDNAAIANAVLAAVEAVNLRTKQLAAASPSGTPDQAAILEAARTAAAQFNRKFSDDQSDDD